jgi:ATP-dependent Clp protease protease subunit
MSLDSTPLGYLIPTVIEKTGRGERAYDIYSRLLEDRIVFIGTGIDDMVANVVIAQLLFLQKENKSQDINLYINSPGGSVTPGWRSTTRSSSCSATSRRTASVRPASMGALLLASGTQGSAMPCPTRVS